MIPEDLLEVSHLLVRFCSNRESAAYYAQEEADAKRIGAHLLKESCRRKAQIARGTAEKICRELEEVYDIDMQAVCKVLDTETTP